jgi:L-fucose isomerase-like protein
MRGKVGFLISHSDNYYGVENELHDKALQELQAFANPLECDIVSYGPIKEADEALAAKEYFELEKVDYLIIFLADFSSGDIMMCFENTAYPIGLWFPKEPYKEGDIQLNAAVSANMFCSIAQRKFKAKVSCDWYYGDVKDKLVKDRLELNLRVAKAKKNIETATVGILGDVAPTFYNLENQKVNERFPDMKIIHFDMDYIVESVKKVTEEETQAAKKLIIDSCNILQTQEKSIINSAKVYVALKKYLLENKIDCLAAACWPDFQDAFQIVPCVIYSLFGSELKIPTACEGDIGGAISLLMAKELSGKVPTLMDLTSIDEETGSLLLWHCGIGSKDLQPDEGVKIINHPMLDRKNPNRELMGLSYDYHFKPGNMTVLRYSNNDKLISFECEVQKSNLGYSGTRGYLNHFTYLGESFKVEDIVDTIFRNGIEHHLIVCPGRIGEALNKLAKEMNIQAITVEKYKRC